MCQLTLSIYLPAYPQSRSHGIFKKYALCEEEESVMPTHHTPSVNTQRMVLLCSNKESIQSVRKAPPTAHVTSLEAYLRSTTTGACLLAYLEQRGLLN